jgi:hypothetical protein
VSGFPARDVLKEFVNEVVEISCVRDSGDLDSIGAAVGISVVGVFFCTDRDLSLHVEHEADPELSAKHLQ